MFSLFLSLMLAAAAPEAATASEQPASTAKPPKPKKICHSQINTGSRMKRTICKTQQEWDEQPTDMRSDSRFSGTAGRN